MSEGEASTRAARTARGFVLAGFAVLIAAVSHMLAGGNTPTILALGATMVVALPLAVALAGKRYGIVRSGVAVGATQGLFHWLFVWVGSPDVAILQSGGSMPSHAEHLGVVAGGLPALSDPVTAGVAMWASHAVAAVLTVLMLRRGEAALVTLRHVLVKFLLPHFARPATTVVSSWRTDGASFYVEPRARIRFTSWPAITYRGPPCVH